jgi:IS30 family transposase
MGWDALTISRELRRNSLPGVNTSPPRRQEFGHWEGDLLQFRTQRGNLLTLIERITRLGSCGLSSGARPSSRAAPSPSTMDPNSPDTRTSRRRWT